MRLLERMKEKKPAEEAEPDASVKEHSAKKKEHGFLDAVKEEIGTPREGEALPHEVTVEDVYQDLIQRKQKGEMPRNPAEALMDVLGKPPASEVYASRAVFELSRQYRDHFLRALQASDDGKLFELFRATFTLFIDQPETAGLTEIQFNKKSEDTDPMKWNVSSGSMPNGDPIALCCIPVQNRTLSARMIGIVFSDSGDKYYSCMLNRDGNTPSDILCGRESMPSVNAGTIEGTDAEPMNCFLNCIKKANSDI